MQINTDKTLNVGECIMKYHPTGTKDEKATRGFPSFHREAEIGNEETDTTRVVQREKAERFDKVEIIGP